MFQTLTCQLIHDKSHGEESNRIAAAHFLWRYSLQRIDTRFIAVYGHHGKLCFIVGLDIR